MAEGNDYTLACPSCKQADGLVTIEDYAAWADVGEVVTDGEGNFDYVHTGEQTMDDGETVGFACTNCMWEMKDEDAPDKNSLKALIPYKEED